MGLLQVGVSILTSLLIGALTSLTRLGQTARIHLLLFFSILAVYWFQPLLPLRFFDFWLPSLTLALVVFAWLLISPTNIQSWRTGRNLPALLVIVGLPIVLTLSRYVFPDPFLTASLPPQISVFLFFVGLSAAIITLLGLLSRRSPALLSIAIVLLILILIVLKSPGLSLQASILIRTITNRSVENAVFTDLRWLGISYIVFRLIHVLRDRQAARLPELSLSEFATYVIFFPSLAAGPIDRAEHFVQDLRKKFVLAQDDTLLGGQRIVLGLFKKFVLADTLALVALNDLLATQIRTPGWMWFAVYAYALQIYFDFSGYTDIAIGIARLVGVQLPENFAAPYLKTNLTQFWNSWHMTLTQWFRSYFFNPFNRWMRNRKNLPPWTMILSGQVATMLLIGLWHGITLNFIFWGLWHGLGLFLQNRWSDYLRKRSPDWGHTSRLQPALHIGGIFVTFHFVALGWVFFALSDPALSWQVIQKLFGI